MCIRVVTFIARETTKPRLDRRFLFREKDGRRKIIDDHIITQQRRYYYSNNGKDNDDELKNGKNNNNSRGCDTVGKHL